MPHADQQIFLPEEGYFEPPEVVEGLGRAVRALPGRLVVLMDPPPERFAGSSILTPQGKHAGKYRPDAGTVVSSGVGTLQVGDRVLVKPYDGLWLTAADADWVPKGREVRLYGVASAWHESVVARMGEADEKGIEK